MAFSKVVREGFITRKGSFSVDIGGDMLGGGTGFRLIWIFLAGLMGGVDNSPSLKLGGSVGGLVGRTPFLCGITGGPIDPGA